VLAALPKSAHPGAKAALAEVCNAEDEDHATKAVKAFEADYGAKWPKAVAKITERIDAQDSVFPLMQVHSLSPDVGLSGAFDHADVNQPVRASSHSRFRRWTLANLPTSAADRDRE